MNLDQQARITRWKRERAVTEATIKALWLLALAVLAGAILTGG